MARIVDSTNQLVSPRWAGDFGSPELGLMRGPFRLDSAQFASTTFTITTGAGAAIGATAIPVTALPVAIPSGTILNWTGAGEFSLLTANAAIGATSLAVEALDVAIEAGDTSSYTTTDTAPVNVASGTPVGRTLAERNAGDDFGPAAAADDEIYLIYFDVQDTSINPDFVAYRPNAGRVVKENFLPTGWDTIAGVVTKLRAAYNLVRGRA